VFLTESEKRRGEGKGKGERGVGRWWKDLGEIE